MEKSALSACPNGHLSAKLTPYLFPITYYLLSITYSLLPVPYYLILYPALRIADFIASMSAVPSVPTIALFS